MKKRILSLALLLCMLLTLLPVGAAAAAADETVSLMSMLPLPSDYCYIDLTGTRDELSETPLSTIVAAVNAEVDASFQIGADDTIAIALSDYGDDYTIVAPSERAVFKVDLSKSSNYLNMIFGTAKQLDGSNKKLRVGIDTTMSDLGSFVLRTEDSTLVTISEIGCYPQTDGRLSYNLYVPSTYAGTTSFYISFAMDNSFNEYTKTVYVGRYETVESAEANGTVVTDEVFGDGYNFGVAKYFTIVLEKDEIKTLKLYYISANIMDGNIGYQTLRTADGSDYVEDSRSSSRGTRFDYDATVTLYKGYPASGYYSIKLYYTPKNQRNNDNSRVTKAAVGRFNSLAEASGATDIKAELFPTVYSDVGYVACFAGDGITFTVFAEDNIFHYTIKVVEGTESPGPIIYTNDDTYFRVRGSKKPSDSGQYSSYRMPYDADSYFVNGYQSLLILETDADMTKLRPVFDVLNGATAYAGAEGAELQTSGVSVQDFSAGPVQYTAKAENNVNIKNYWVTFVKKTTGGAKLFVNGPDERMVFLTGVYGNHHDVFFANTGDAEMTGISVELTDAVNVKLDNYWTAGGDGNNTLAAFTEVYSVDNVGKVRLVPDGTGVVSGTLTISAAGQTARTITLTGFAGNPEITTERLGGQNAVKYVPYSRMVQTNNSLDDILVVYSISSGTLPAGIELNSSTGEIYGVPTETGLSTFSVKAEFKYTGEDFVDLEFEPSIKSYTIQVDDNTDANVDNQSDHTLTETVEDMTTRYFDQVFEIDNPLDEFSKFFLDGNLLVADRDYTAEEGSTRITIRSKTFSTAGRGSHTIAAEFRDAGNVMTKGAQNYNSTVQPVIIDDSQPPSNPATNPTKPTPDDTVVVFDDVKATDWFYDDVMWASENGYMIGTGNSEFSPLDPVSAAMVLTTLARLGNVDLKDYSSAKYDDITDGEWYSEAAAWGRETKLIGDEIFDANGAFSRGKMAILLVKFLKSLGIECEMPEHQTAFVDIDQMTAEENEAFQILFSVGIFKGCGNLDMNPSGTTSRAEYATLLHRIATLLVAEKG